MAARGCLSILMIVVSDDVWRAFNFKKHSMGLFLAIGELRFLNSLRNMCGTNVKKNEFENLRFSLSVYIEWLNLKMRQLTIVIQEM